MSKDIKGEYAAVPTHDIDQEAGLPAYSKVENTEVIIIDNAPAKRRRRLRFMLIGGAVALLGLTQLCSGPMKDYAEASRIAALPENQLEPCSIRHSEQFNELKQHMDYLTETFRGPESQWRADHHGKHHHGKHHKNKEFHHKHHHGEEFHHKEHKPHGEVVKAKEVNKGDLKNKVHDFVDKVFEFVGEDEKKPEHRHPQPFCRTQELKGTTTALSFSPQDFQNAGILSKSFFSPGSRIRLVKSADASVENIQLNVTVFAGREELEKQVKISAFDHNGQYTVQVEREGGHPHFPFPHHPKHGEHPSPPKDGDREERTRDKKHRKHPKCHPEPKKEDCLYYEVDVVFPPNVTYFDNLLLESKGAFIKGGEGLENVEFGQVKAGLDHGAVIFKGLKAKKLIFGVLHGVVMGDYQPSESFVGGAVHGAVKVNIEPTGQNVNITAVSTFGPVSVDVPADKYSGDFTLFNVLGEQSSIEAPNPEDIHVTKYKHHIKSGYYKEEATGSRIIAEAKIHGGESIKFY